LSHAKEPLRQKDPSSEAAKEATGWRKDGCRSLPADAPPKLFTIRSTMKRRCKKQTKQAWGVKWRKGTKGRATYRHTPIPTKKVLRLQEGLTKRESALLVQMRTKKIGLSDFLFTRRVSDVASPHCDCGARRQTVAYILLHCSERRDLQNRMFGNLPGRDNLRTILNTPQLATKAIQYIEQT
jgi:hypothetical protein